MAAVRRSSSSSSATRQPSSPGIITSRRMTSGVSLRAVSSPLGPSAASSTSMPSASRFTRQSSRIGASSSITRTRVPTAALSLPFPLSDITSRQWQLEREPRPAPFLGIDPHPAAHLAHEALRDEEPEPGSLSAARLVELREDTLALGLRDADALVCDRQLDRVLDAAGGDDD